MDGDSAVVRRPRLTVAIVSRNDAVALPETLASVAALADEVLVADLGSLDQTGAIAARRGARVERIAWADDYSAVRNRVLHAAVGNWILWLEPGERVQPESLGELRQFIDRGADAKSAYMLMVESAADVGASPEQSMRLRLMPVRDDLWFEGQVGESVRACVDRLSMAVGPAPGRILGDVRRLDSRFKAERAREVLRLVTCEAEQQGSYSARLLLTQGAAFDDLGNPDSACVAYQQALTRCTGGSTQMLEAYYGLLAALEAAGKRERRIPVCVEAMEHYPLDAQLLLAMGNYMQEVDKLDLAIRSFEIAVRHGQIDLETWHLRDLPELSSLCWGLALEAAGRDDEARLVFEDAVRRVPSSARLARQLLEVLVKQGATDEALRISRYLPAGAAQRAAMDDALRGACHAARGEWPQALGCLQAAHLAGYQEAFCLRWLALTLLSMGQVEPAGQVLAQWATIEPDHPELKAFQGVLGQVPERGGVATTNRRRLDSCSMPSPTAPAMAPKSAPTRHV